MLFFWVVLLSFILLYALLSALVPGWWLVVANRTRRESFFWNWDGTGVFLWEWNRTWSENPLQWFDQICTDVQISNIRPSCRVIDPLGWGKTEGAWRLIDPPPFIKVSQTLRFRQDGKIIIRHVYKTGLLNMKGMHTNTVIQTHIKLHWHLQDLCFTVPQKEAVAFCKEPVCAA